MKNGRQSFFKFLETQVAARLTGLVTPDFVAQIRLSNEPVNYGNILNVTFLMDRSIMRSNPPYRELTVALDLIAKVSDPSVQRITEGKILDAMHLINQIMAVQTCSKKNYSVTPAVDLNSNLSWMGSYSADWHEGAVVDSNYFHKKTTLQVRYFEETLT